jgi:hypothetical protein
VIPTAKPYYTSHIRQAKQRKGFASSRIRGDKGRIEPM